MRRPGNIVIDIHNQAAAFLCNTGREATSLYLGEEEYDDLRLEAGANSIEVGSYRLAPDKFGGMNIYRVKIKSHLNVSGDPL